MKQIFIHALPRGWGKSTQARELFQRHHRSILLKGDPHSISSEDINYIIMDDCSIDFIKKVILACPHTVEKISIFCTFNQDPKVYLIPEIPRKWKVRLHSVVFKEEIF